MNDAADDYLDAGYAEWLMQQPEAGICNGDMLIKRMEQEWGIEDFSEQFLSGKWRPK
jgi:hypothetical protein